MGQLYVVVRHASDADRIYEVNEPEILIGRHEDCALWLPDPRVSRNHALLLSGDDGQCIRDLRSRNGTFLGGKRIKQHAPLCHGSEVEVGPYRVLMCLGIEAAVKEAGLANKSTQPGEKDAGLEFKLPRGIGTLTSAQRRVYNLFAQGLIEKEVAARLGISANTVHDHAKAIYKALSVSTRGELVLHWAQHAQLASGDEKLPNE